MVPDNKSNKIGTKLRGIMLQSQLYGRERDLRRAIRNDVIESDQGQTVIFGATY